MADKSFGVKELNLLNASGTPTVTSPNNLNLNANTVAISTSCTIGSNLDVDGTTNLDNTDIVGITTIRNASGTKLYEGVANGSKLFHAGTERLSTETYGIDINGTLGADQINCSGVSTITVPANTNPHSSWDVVNNSASSYRFTGPGQDGAEDNPDIYLVRGQRYLFKMNASGHPFQIRVSNGGSAYSDGVTNNGAQTGNVVFNVQHDAPAHLFYQCTSHGSMVGNIYIVGQHLANGANNRVLTATSAYGINAESNMTFDGDDLTISHSGLAVNIFESTDNHSRLRIRSSDASLGQLEFADQTDADAGEIRYDHANDKMTFHVGNNVARVGIDSTGNLGLGTISPDYNLDISNSSGEAQLRIDSSAGNHGMIRFSQAGTNKSYIQHVNGNHLAFGPGGSEKVRITSGGKVGIQTNNPQHELDLGGVALNQDDGTEYTLRIRSNNGKTAIRVGGGGGGSRVNLMRFDGDSNPGNGVGCSGDTNAGAYGGTLVYHGDRSGNENSFAVYMDQNANATQIEAFNIRQNGDYMHGGSSYSDRDQKENITAISGTALDKITQLSPKTWNWKPEYHDIPTDRVFAGFIAQEVQPHIPSIVTGTDGQGDMALDYQGLLAWTIKAVTELNSKVDTLEQENIALRARVTNLEGQ